MLCIWQFLRRVREIVCEARIQFILVQVGPYSTPGDLTSEWLVITGALLSPTCEISDINQLHPEETDLTKLHRRRPPACSSLLKKCEDAQSSERILLMSRPAPPDELMVQAASVLLPTGSSAATHHDLRSELGQ